MVNFTLGNKFQWNFNRNSNIFIQENAIENVVCEMASILSRPQCVNVIVINTGSSSVVVVISFGAYLPLAHRRFPPRCGPEWCACLWGFGQSFRRSTNSSVRTYSNGRGLYPPCWWGKPGTNCVGCRHLGSDLWNRMTSSGETESIKTETWTKLCLALSSAILSSAGTVMKT